MSENYTFRSEWEAGFDAHQKGWRPSNEFDWFALDSKGEIACFMTAGFALVPKLVFRDKEILWKIYNYFYKEPEDYAYVRKTSSLLEYDVSHYAAKGLYSYDNPSDIQKPYRLIRSPEISLHVSTLPTEIREWLEPLTIKELTFADSPKIDMDKYFDCI
jgi:hypothetical protein